MIENCILFACFLICFIHYSSFVFRRSLDLIDLLMHLADRGLVSQVQDVLEFPIQHCPDILIVALLQINQPMTLFRQELLSSLIPIFLSNHVNSTVILHQVWHTQVSI